nr:hypothetical protein [Tanacetum cinerariifolium]
MNEAVRVRIIKEQVKGQVKEQISRILPRIKQSVNAQLEAEVLTRSSHSSRTSYVVAADLSEMELKKILIEKMEGSKEPESTSAPLQTATRSACRSTTGSKSRQVSAIESTFVEEPVQTTCQMDEPSYPVFKTGADHDWNKTLPAVQRSTQTWISELAKQADSRSFFNELLDTPLDFSNFIMNRLRVDALTPELLAGPTFDLMNRSCISLIELEYHLEEPLSLIPDNRGRRVIPFAYFINNDLEYLQGEELYRDVNINQGRGIQATLDVEDSHMTLTPVHPDGQQESSSVSSQFVTSMLNPPSDAGMESIFAIASSLVAPLQTSTPIMTPSTIATITTISHTPIPPTTIPSEVLQNLPTFDSVFCFEDRLKSLEANFSKYIQTNPFTEAVSNISGIFHQYMNQQMTEAKMEGNKSIQRSDEQKNLYKALVDAYVADKTILDSYEDTVILKRRRDDDDQEEGPFAGSDRGSKRRREGKEPESASALLETATRSAGRSTIGSKSLQVSASADDQTIVQSSQHPECLIELEYHLEEVYKATTDQLDWVNHEGQQYPHNLLQPLPLIPDNRGRRVIPFAHFINNDLEYLRGGASSRKYTTSVPKTKAADYENIKWIEDLVPRSMWIQEPINYDKHALWGVSHWGRKRQQFYGFDVNRESALDVYSRGGSLLSQISRLWNGIATSI